MPLSSPQLRVRALIHTSGYILLARLAIRPVAFLPGGRVEPGETLLLAIQREIREETGSEASELSYLGCIENIWTEGTAQVHDLNHFFLADVPTLKPERVPLCKDNGVEMFWMSMADIDRTPIEPHIQKSFIKRTLAGDKAAWWAFADETK